MRQTQWELCRAKMVVIPYKFKYPPDTWFINGVQTCFRSVWSNPFPHQEPMWVLIVWRLSSQGCLIASETTDCLWRLTCLARCPARSACRDLVVAYLAPREIMLDVAVVRRCGFMSLPPPPRYSTWNKGKAVQVKNRWESAAGCCWGGGGAQTRRRASELRRSWCKKCVQLCERLSLGGKNKAKKDGGLREASGKKSRMNEGLNTSHPGSH